ncbi:putative trans-sialidase [Trypanosoma grayi]|uniref:putative trans-sialidase n=1 Tax=Trypanosoma grayi TaxID=71804 RepID=UPI0004F45D21|nr:putative trans-sialidase [Trypanosoma grayi]KEG12637.1 putative trans-sialidase [Trypanosoma grayi]
MMRSRGRGRGGAGSGGVKRELKDRSAFWVAPPQSFVTNRHAPTAVPHSLSVIVVVDPNMVEPTAFLQDIAPITMAGGTRKEDAVSDGAGSSTLVEERVIPSFFKVPVYVWEDTTLREILEEVLASSAAARRVLLPPAVDATSDTTHPVASVGDGHGSWKLAEQEEGGNAEGLSKAGAREGEGDENGGAGCAQKEDDDKNPSDSLTDEEPDEGPPAKRERTEAGRNTNNKEGEEEDKQKEDAPFTRRGRRRGNRPPPLSVAKVHLSHVFVDPSRKPQIRGITVLRVDRPVFHTGDHITMHELRLTKGASRGWKTGDLLVLAPTVRHHRPTASANGGV